MIVYEQDTYGLKLLLMRHGSVFPNAAKFAIGPALLAFIIRLICALEDIEYDMQKLREGYGSFVFVLGFALVFRSGTAYNRYWDGANLIRQMRTEWHDACAQICVFAYTSDKPKEEKEAYCNCVVRLFSLLHCLALQQVADMQDESFEVIDLEDMDQQQLQSLQEFHEPLEKAEIVLQWIQRTILEGIKDKYIPTPPPIVSRAFQEINSGMVCLSKLQCITDHPFPFPYAQMIAGMLTVHWIVTPILVGMIPINYFLSFVFSFISVFCLVALNLIAQEIENPFGDDENDLRCDEAQACMNEALLLLLRDASTAMPNYKDKPAKKDLKAARQTKRLSAFLPKGDISESLTASGASDGSGSMGFGSKGSKKKRGSRSSRSSRSSDASHSNPPPKVSIAGHAAPGEDSMKGQPVKSEQPSHSTLNIHSDNAIVNISGPAAGQPTHANHPPPQLSFPEHQPALPLASQDKMAVKSQREDAIPAIPVTKGGVPEGALSMKEQAGAVVPLDISAQLREISDRAEMLQKQNIVEVKDVQSKLGTIVQLVSQGLSLASEAGLAVRHVSFDGLESTPLKSVQDKSTCSEGHCRLFRT